MLEAWTRLQALGFHLSDAAVRVWYDAYAQDGFGPEARARHYVGYLGDEPVTCATLLPAEGLAGIFDVATHPAHRRRGFGAAITHRALTDAVYLGYGFACLQACQMAVSLYESLGFVCQFHEREYHWRRPAILDTESLSP